MTFVLIAAALVLLTAIITADAIRSLKLRRGDDALAIIKSTEVMISKPPASMSSPRATRGPRPRRGRA